MPIKAKVSKDTQTPGACIALCSAEQLRPRIEHHHDEIWGFVIPVDLSRAQTRSTTGSAGEALRKYSQVLLQT